MSAISPALANLAKAVADELRGRENRPLEPPAGLPERVLIWLALAPVWTARMAAFCGFPTEADEKDRAARKWLERQATSPEQGDAEAACAAQHMLGVLALRDGRLEGAEGFLLMAHDGHRRLGHRAGALAAEYHLGVIAVLSDRPDKARERFSQASSDQNGWTDDVCTAVMRHQLASLASRVPEPLITGLADETPAIVMPPELEDAALEAARVMERIAASELCVSALGDAPESEADTGDRLTERRYWMIDVLRQQIVERVMRDPAQGIPAAKQELRRIGQGVLRAAQSGIPVLRTTRQWARLAALADDVAAMAALLTRECDRLLTSATATEQNPSGVALAWIQAAEPLDELLKGELTPALAKAKRQLDLFHRRRDDDQRYLRHFIPRTEQISAVEGLLSDERAWALHFVGAGGTGKTMLMRYISSALGPRIRASTARVDFDYLNPEYPAQKPGMLLAELAEELRLHADDAAFSLFARFDEQLVKLHEQRTAVSQGAVAEQRASATIEEVQQAFSRALAALPAPVILLIDTCEELAKVRPDGASPEGVVRTFAILNELWRTVPGLKVIFAGRRPLARKGHGWRARDCDELPDRPYLRLHEIRGFDESEAMEYLTSEGVPEELRGPVLSQSRDRSDHDRFIWDDPAQAPAKLDRFSPFELSGWAALARWRAGEHLTPADIVSADSDQYVQLRIIRRIRYDPLKRTLPVLGLVGRCDPALLRAALPGLSDFDEMFRELKQQEWISRRGVDFYEMDESLRRRLLAHFERVQPDEVERCYRRIADYLADRTLNEPLSSLLPFHFDTAMRVLQREPARAARWWARAEARFAGEGQYEWARQLAEFMLGQEGACAELDPYGGRPSAVAALRAAVLATQMACFTHRRPAADRLAGWVEAESLLPDFPDPGLAACLRFRVDAGKIAAAIGHAAQPAPAPEPAAVRRLAESLPEDPQLDASFVAAVEALAEQAEQETTPGPWRAAAAELDMSLVIDPMAARAFSIYRPDLMGFAWSLSGRIALLKGRFDEAARWFRGSLRLHRRNEESDHRWLDWRPPDDLGARLRLEFARGMYPAVLGAEKVLDAIGPAPADLSTVDAERLASAMLILRTAVAPVRSDSLPSLGRAPSLRPERNAHRAFPPLATTVAETMAGVGDVDGALELLATASRGWERSSVEFESVAHAERATLRIIRRMRLRDEGRGLNTALADSPDLADVELLWSLDGLDGAKATARSGTDRIELEVPAGTDADAWRHARWRTLNARAWPAEAINDFGEQLLLGNPRQVTESFSRYSLFLDHLEAERLMRDDVPAPSHETFETFENWWRDHRHQPEEALRFLLRSAALGPRQPRRAAVPNDLIERLGRRRAAEIALDEGEMLALRLSGRARPIVDTAEDWFAKCGDHVGAVIAQTLSALLLVRMGLRTAVSSLLRDKTATDLENLPFLPSWGELRNLAEARTGEGTPENLRPPGWRPWLVRLVACRTWASLRAGRAVRLRRLQDWIYDHYGEERLETRGTASTVEIAVPTELDHLLDVSGTSTEPFWVNASDLSGFRSRWRQATGLRRRAKLLTAFILRPLPVATAVLLIPIVLVAVLGPRAFAPLLWFYCAGVVAFFAGQVLIGHRWRYRPVLSAGGTPIAATLIVRGGSTRDGTVGLTLDAQGHSTIREYLRPPSVDSSYEDLSTRLPEVVAARLEKISGRRRDTRRVVEIRLDQGLGAPCWEAMLPVNPGAEHGHSIPLRVVRTVLSRRTRPTKSWRDIRSALSLLADLRQDEMATQGWRRFFEKRQYSHEIRRPDEVYSHDNVGEEIDVLHIVATPIETASGPRLDLGRTTGARLGSKQSGQPRGELMQPADVVRLFPDLVCCVLQATPQERTHRTEAERRQAATLRLMAEEIFSLGVTAVVTIPTLPASVAADLLGTLAEAVSGRSSRPVLALTGAISHAREKMASSPGLTAEAGFDICLYATEARLGP
jgi:hypothetical protein